MQIDTSRPDLLKIQIDAAIQKLIQTQLRATSQGMLRMLDAKPTPPARGDNLPHQGRHVDVLV